MSDNKLRMVLEEYIYYREKDRRLMALRYGYNIACAESEEITKELREILNGNYSCVEKFGDNHE